MKRLSALTIGVLVAVIAAWVMISPFFSSRRHIEKSSAAVSDVTDVPIALQQRADCMYQVLTTIPSVQQPRQGRTTSRGWTHPFVEYTANTRVGPVPLSVEAQRDGRNPDEYWYWFLADFAGPIPPGFDYDQLESIIRKWHGLCHVVATAEAN